MNNKELTFNDYMKWCHPKAGRLRRWWEWKVWNITYHFNKDSLDELADIIRGEESE